MVVFSSTPVPAALYNKHFDLPLDTPSNTTTINLADFPGCVVVVGDNFGLRIEGQLFKIVAANLVADQRSVEKLWPDAPDKFYTDRHSVQRAMPKNTISVPLNWNTPQKKSKAICPVCVYIIKWDPKVQAYIANTEKQSHYDRHCAAKDHLDYAQSVLKLEYIVTEPWKCVVCPTVAAFSRKDQLHGHLSECHDMPRPTDKSEEGRALAKAYDDRNLRVSIEYVDAVLLRNTPIAASSTPTVDSHPSANTLADPVVRVAPSHANVAFTFSVMFDYSIRPFDDDYEFEIRDPFRIFYDPVYENSNKRKRSGDEFLDEAEVAAKRARRDDLLKSIFQTT